MLLSVTIFYLFIFFFNKILYSLVTLATDNNNDIVHYSTASDKCDRNIRDLLYTRQRQIASPPHHADSVDWVEKVKFLVVM